MQQAIDTNKYLLRYSIVYAISSILIGVLAHFLKFNPGIFIALAIVMVSARICVEKLIRDNQRAPNKKEQIKLSWQCLVASWVVSVTLMMGGLLVVEGTEKTAEILSVFENSQILSITLVSSAFLSIIMFGIFWLSFGWLANKQFEKLQNLEKL